MSTKNTNDITVTEPVIVEKDGQTAIAVEGKEPEETVQRINVLQTIKAASLQLNKLKTAGVIEAEKVEEIQQDLKNAVIKYVTGE